MDNNITISQLENLIHVKLKKLEKGEEKAGNCYYISTSYSPDQSIKYEKLTELCLTNIQFNDFTALEGIFNTLISLKLTDCVIADAWQLHQLKKLDRLTLINCSFSADADTKRKSDFYLSSLDLENTSTAHIETLATVFYSVLSLSISGSHLNDLASLLSFDFVGSLSLYEVTFKNENFDPDVPKAKTMHRHFQSLYLENMNLPHPGFYLPISTHLEYVEFLNCEVSNLNEFNLFPYLYSLTFDNTDYVGVGNEKEYLAEPDRRFTFLKFENMKLKDFDYFVPISPGLAILDLYNCEIECLNGISKLSDIRKLRLHPNIQINDLSYLEEPLETFELEQCIIGPRTTTYHMDDVELSPNFNIELLKTVAPYIKSLIIQGYHPINTEHLKHFKQLDQLSFDRCKIDLSDYSSIASQIKKLSFDTTEIINPESFSLFTSLEHIDANSFKDDLGHINLKHLLPLRHHLKTFDVSFYLIENIEELRHFTALEELDASVNSLELAQDILSIKSLKKLELDIDDVTPAVKEAVSLDLQHLNHIEKISLRAEKGISFKGIGHLKTLKTLELNFECDLENLADLTSLEKLIIDGEDFNKLPPLHHIKVIDLTINDDHPVKSIEHFPSLEKLKVSVPQGHSVAIRDLDNLTVLIIETHEFESIACLENLPKLEELDLGHCEITRISKLDDLTNLKTLNLEENDIDSLMGLEKLKNLERLNLYYNKISDVSLLNKLPKLTEVNLAGNEIEKHEAENQLEKPEIAIWYGRPYIPFRISID